MAISNQTLSQDVWNEIRTVLVAAAIQTTVGTDVKSASIEASYNDESPNKPQIIIEPIPIEKENDKFDVTTDNHQGKRFINVTVGCYTDKSIALDQLYDQVVYAIDGTIIEGVDLRGYTTDVAFNTSASSKVMLKSVTFSYDRE